MTSLRNIKTKQFCLIPIFYTISQLSHPTTALPAWSGKVDSPSKRESAEAQKMPKNAVRTATASRVHAVLGAAFRLKNVFASFDQADARARFFHCSTLTPLINSHKRNISSPKPVNRIIFML